MISSHTPGPWTCNANYGTCHYMVWDADGNYHEMHDAIAEMDANARLIAAAPFMLQILETIALHAPSLDATGIRELCDEAVAMAKGAAK